MQPLLRRLALPVRAARSALSVAAAGSAVAVARSTIALALCASGVAAAQAPKDATLRMTVVDQSGAVIPGARVTLQPVDPSGPPVEISTDARGEAVFASLPPGRYAVRGDFPGFESRQIEDLRLRVGATRRELRLPIARHAEDVQVGQSGRDRALDPRSGAFASVLSRDQIDALPDDPDEMEAALKEMAGPGAVIRVDGFRGGKLPPKSQIRGIRFRRDSFAAENHGGGLVFVDITTNPGGGPLRGTADFTFRDESLNARNAFSPARSPEQQQNYGFTLNGTLVKDRTSFSLTSNGTNSYDSQTIFAAVPGSTVADAVRRPTDRTNFSARIDHALTKSHTLKATYQRSTADIDNLGVGDFNLQSRAYSRRTNEDLFRSTVSGPIGRKAFAETRFQARHQTLDSSSLTDAATIRVLDAFTSGGAQIGGGRITNDFELASDVDYATGRHAARFGFLLEGGRYRSDEVQNAGGTFTFSSLDAYLSGRPSTYTQRTGNPLVSYSDAQLGWYAQDDIRVARSLSVSLGLRQELQTHIDDRLNLAPRLGVTWSPFKSGSTTVRGGAGIFYDWYDAQTYEQTLRVDGTHQVDLAVINPGYPNPFIGGSVAVLPPGRIVQSPDLVQPTLARSNLAVEQALGKHARLIALYGYGRSRTVLRGHDINAPLADGQRPDASSGTVTQVESTARSSTHMLHTGLNVNLPWHRTFLFMNYTLGRAMNEADSPFSLPADNQNLSAEWGPTPYDARHRASAMLNMNLWNGFKLATTVNASSGLPYNITTGFDDNHDTVSNDRPAGVSRNSARGEGRWDLGGRLSWGFGFGQRTDSGGGTPAIFIRTIGGPGGGDTPMGGFTGGAEDKRWRVELYLAGTNLFNHVNPSGYSGVLTSPFFGQPTSAGAQRKLELGMRFGF
jgi:hypothetical protein